MTLILFLLLWQASAFAAPVPIHLPPNLSCHHLIEYDRPFPNRVTIRVVSPEEKRPVEATVEGLPGLPTLRMTYQNLMGVGPLLDGIIFYGNEDMSPGLIQDICGDRSLNAYIFVDKGSRGFCARCAPLGP